MTQTPYGIVREACVKANPEEFGHQSIYNGSRPIRLADVLLALNKPVKMLTKIPTVPIEVGMLLGMWNLRNDSLEWHRDNQPETVEWLANLLTNK